MDLLALIGDPRVLRGDRDFLRVDDGDMGVSAEARSSCCIGNTLMAETLLRLTLPTVFPPLGEERGDGELNATDLDGRGDCDGVPRIDGESVNDELICPDVLVAGVEGELNEPGVLRMELS